MTVGEEEKAIAWAGYAAFCKASKSSVYPAAVWADLTRQDFVSWWVEASRAIIAAHLGAEPVFDPEACTEAKKESIKPNWMDITRDIATS